MSELNLDEILNQYYSDKTSKINIINKLISSLKNEKNNNVKSAIYDLFIKIVENEDSKFLNQINENVSPRFKELKIDIYESIALELLENYLNVKFTNLTGCERISSVDNGFIFKDGHIVHLIIYTYENYSNLNLKFLDNLEKLGLTIKGLKVIKGLESKKKLNLMIIFNSKLEEIREADSLVNLKTLHISGVENSDIKGLNELKSLESLCIWGSLSKIPKLDNLTNLIQLDLSRNEIIEINGLECLCNLKSLKLSENKITKICGLDFLKDLESLYLGHNKIKDIEGLDELVKLEHLGLSNNLISEIKGLEKLTKLKSLWLDRNKIIKISNLDTLRNLKYINLEENPLSNEESALLKSNKDAQKIVKWCQHLKKPAISPSEIYDNFINKLIPAKSAIRDLQILLENSPFDNIRMNAIEFLSKINNNSEEIFTILKNILISDSNENVRSIAAKEIINRFLNESEKILIHTIKNEKSSEVVISIYNTLKRINSEKSEKFLQEMAKILGTENKIKYNIDLTEAMGLRLLEQITCVEAVKGGYMDHDSLSFDVKENHITYLDIHDARCENLTFLELFPYLNSLRIERSELKKINGLENLKNLKSLTLRGFELDEIPNLGKLKDLERLNIDCASIKNLDGIENLKKLRDYSFEDINLNDEELEKYLSKIPYELFLRGMQSLRNKVYHEAIESFKNVVSLYNEFSDAWFFLGISYQDINEIDKAKEAYEKAEKYLPVVKIKYVNPKVVVENYKKNLINQNFTIEVLFSIAENAEYQGEQENALNYLKDFHFESKKYLESLKNIISKCPHSIVKKTAVDLIIQKYSENSLDYLKNLLINEKDRYVRDGIATFLYKHPNLQLKKLLKFIDFIIYEDNLYTYTNSLHLGSKGIFDITKIQGFENCQNLKELDLRDNQISKIYGLKNLKNLKKLNLGNNKIIKIEGLEDLTNLEELALYGNQIQQIQGLDNLRNLRVLELYNNEITKIQGLENLQKLENLRLPNNKLNSIEGIKWLNPNSIRHIDLFNNPNLDLSVDQEIDLRKKFPNTSFRISSIKFTKVKKR